MLFRPALYLLLVCLMASGVNAQLYRDSTGLWKPFLHTAYEQYDQVQLYSDSLAIVSARGKYGLASPSGRLVCPVQYDRLWASYPPSGFFAASRDGKFGYLNEQGLEAISFRYDFAQCFYEGLAVVQSADRWGYIDTSGVLSGVFPDQAGAHRFENGFAVLMDRDKSRFGVMDRYGRLIVPVRYPACRQVLPGAWLVQDTMGQTWLLDDQGVARNKEPFDDMLPLAGGGFLARKEGVWRRYNANNQADSAETWDAAGDGRFWKQNYILVKKKGLAGLLDSLGNTVLPCAFHTIYPFETDEYRTARKVSRDRQWGCFYEGRLLLPCGYQETWYYNGVFFGALTDSIHFTTDADSRIRAFRFQQAVPLSASRISFQDNGLYGLADTAGRVLVAPSYRWLIREENVPLFRISRFGYTGWMDEDGRERIPPVYEGENAGFDKYGRSIVQRGGLYGLLDTSGRLVLDCRYDAIRCAFHYTPLYLVQKGRQWGCVDYNGREILPLAFDELAATFESPWILARKGGFWGLFYRGEAVLPLAFEEIVSFRFPFILARKGGKWGALHALTGQTIQAFEWDIALERISNSPLIVRKNGKYGALDAKLQITVPPVFDSLIFGYEWLLAMENGRWGTIDLQGRWLQAPEWDSVWYGGGDVHWYYRKNKRTGLVGGGGKAITPPRYDEFVFLTEPRFAIAARRGREWTLMDQYGAPRGRFRASRAGVYRDGVLEIKNRRGWRLLDVQTLTREKRVYEQLVHHRDFNLYWARKGDKWGVLNARGELLVPCLYDKLESYRHISARKGQKFGLFDTDGKMLLPPEYDRINLFSYENGIYYSVKKNGKDYFFFPETGEIRDAQGVNQMSDHPGKHVKVYRTALIESCARSKYGLLKPDSTRLLDCEYPRIELLEDSLFVVKKDRGVAIYHIQGGFLTGFDFEEIRPSGRPGLFLSAQNGEWGGIDRNGKTILPFGAAGRAALGPELFEFCTQQYACGARDWSGKTVVPPIYSRLSFRDGTGLIEASVREGTDGLLRADGTVLVPPQYDRIQPCAGGYLVWSEDKCGLLKTDGALVAAPVYDEIIWRREGCFIARKDSRCGLFGSKGDTLIPVEYEFIDVFYAGLAAARRNGKWGYLRENGETAIPFIYDFACNFHPDNRTAVVLDTAGVSWVINASGALLEQTEYQCDRGHQSYNPKRDTVLKYEGMTLAVFPHPWERVECGLAIFDLGGKKGIMDLSGRILCPARFDWLGLDASCRAPNLVLARLDGKFGYVDKQGNIVIPFRYAEAGFFGWDGRAPVRKGKNWFKIDGKGKCVEGCD